MHKTFPEGSIEWVTALIVSQQDLATASGLLKQLSLLHAILKIKPHYRADVQDGFAIPIHPPPGEDVHEALRDVLTRLRTAASSTVHTADLPLSFFTTKSRTKPETPEQIIRTTFNTWLATQPDPLHTLSSHLLASLPKSYTVYGALLLFPTTSFRTTEWDSLLTSPTSPLTTFFANLATRLKLTHIAINAPIPLSNPTNDPNTLRTPASLLPLHGDFGPALQPTQPPSPHDLRAAFWTSTTQNHLPQTWAPRYTMFSAGNIKEKARLLALPSVEAAVAQGIADGRGCAAVDLYVGIGYFAFSYLKAGVRVVLGWDLNPWSVEGARRGAGKKGWGVEVREGGLACVDGEEESEGGVAEAGLQEGTRLVLFCEDNRRACGRLKELRGVPPVRHVNCGLLPSSKGSWETAVEVLDKGLGGWIHVHENFGVKEIEDKAGMVRSEIEVLVRASGAWPKNTVVKIDEIFRVKSYAPGVMHCVVDIHIDPRGESSS